MEKINIILGIATQDGCRAAIEIKKYFQSMGGMRKLLETIDHETKKVDKVMYTAFLQMGVLYLKNNQLEKAVDIMTACIHLFGDENPIEIWHDVGMCLYKMEKYNEAGPYLVHYCKKNPSDYRKVQPIIQDCVSRVRSKA